MVTTRPFGETPILVLLPLLMVLTAWLWRCRRSSPPHRDHVANLDGAAAFYLRWAMLGPIVYMLLPIILAQLSHYYGHYLGRGMKYTYLSLFALTAVSIGYFRSWTKYPILGVVMSVALAWGLYVGLARYGSTHFYPFYPLQSANFSKPFFRTPADSLDQKFDDYYVYHGASVADRYFFYKWIGDHTPDDAMFLCDDWIFRPWAGRANAFCTHDHSLVTSADEEAEYQVREDAVAEITGRRRSYLPLILTLELLPQTIPLARQWGCDYMVVAGPPERLATLPNLVHTEGALALLKVTPAND